MDNDGVNSHTFWLIGFSHALRNGHTPETNKKNVWGGRSRVGVPVYETRSLTAHSQ